MGAALTTEEFIIHARLFHGDKHDYSRVMYVNCFTNVEIIYIRHNKSFYKKPLKHLVSKAGCDECPHHTKKSYGYLFNKTIERENFFRSAGYTVISIWEMDWKREASSGK